MPRYLRELLTLRQHADDPKGAGSAALAGQVHAARLRGPDATDLGAGQPVWAVRTGHEHTARPAVIEMVAGDTTACSTPFCDEDHRLALHRLISWNSCQLSKKGYQNQKQQRLPYTV
ncbi:hypothetical protein [Xylella fastidiosa]|uniref:hypothetical protein n=1 Tax=Xylella fastidiosa TaxID=2371 RepID=UPI0026C2D7EF